MAELGPPSALARHVGYTASGVPIVRRMYGVQCLSAIPDFLGSRQVGYTAGGLPITAWAWECCDGVCPDSEEDCYVEELCFPPSGVTRKVALYVTDAHSCWSGRNKYTILTYDDLTGTWTGDPVTLRGGDLFFELSCLGSGFFRLSWSGCESGFADTENGCLDPLVLSFPNIQFGACCDCQITGPPGTDDPAELTFTVVANCRKTVFARHVGYLADGTPVVARANPCPWGQQTDTMLCLDMTCPIQFEIINLSGCLCFDGATGDLDYASAQWSYIGGFPCPGGVGTMTVTCTDLGNGMTRLTVVVVCGVTAGGSAFVDILDTDLEDLDALVDVPISNASDPTECCSGSIRVRLLRP